MRGARAVLAGGGVSVNSETGSGSAALSFYCGLVRGHSMSAFAVAIGGKADMR